MTGPDRDARLEAAYRALCDGPDSPYDTARRHGVGLDELQARCGERDAGHTFEAHDAGAGVFYTFHGVWCSTCGAYPDESY